jgi:hypothetical protein
MKYTRIVLTIICFTTLLASAQKPVGVRDEADKRNFSVLLQAASFLKNHPTPVLNFNDSTALRVNRTVYDTLIDRFYDLNYLRDSIKDKQPFTARVLLQKAILYNIDHFLGILPSDSVCIAPLISTELASDTAQYPPNTLVVYYPLAAEPFYTTVISFNAAGRIVFVSPLIHFFKRKDPDDVEAFYMRHGYDLIEPYLFKP